MGEKNRSVCNVWIMFVKKYVFYSILILYSSEVDKAKQFSVLYKQLFIII